MGCPVARDNVGIRPRSLTSIPCSRAHDQTAAAEGRLWPLARPTVRADAPDRTRVADISGQCLTQFLAVLGLEITFLNRSVEAETKSLGCPEPSMSSMPSTNVSTI